MLCILWEWWLPWTENDPQEMHTYGIAHSYYQIHQEIKLFYVWRNYPRQSVAVDIWNSVYRLYMTNSSLTASFILRYCINLISLLFQVLCTSKINSEPWTFQWKWMLPKRWYTVTNYSKEILWRKLVLFDVGCLEFFFQL